MRADFASDLIYLFFLLALALTLPWISIPLFIIGVLVFSVIFIRRKYPELVLRYSSDYRISRHRKAVVAKGVFNERYYPQSYLWRKLDSLLGERIMKSILKDLKDFLKEPPEEAFEQIKSESEDSSTSTTGPARIFNPENMSKSILNYIVENGDFFLFSPSAEHSEEDIIDFLSKIQDGLEQEDLKLEVEKTKDKGVTGHSFEELSEMDAEEYASTFKVSDGKEPVFKIEGVFPDSDSCSDINRFLEDRGYQKRIFRLPRRTFRPAFILLEPEKIELLEDKLGVKLDRFPEEEETLENHQD